jgi:hexosaminidase
MTPLQVFLLTFFVILNVFLTDVSALWPEPKSYSHGDSVLWLSPSCKIFQSSDKSDSESYLRHYATYVGFESFYDYLYSQYFFSRDHYGRPTTSGIIASAISRAQARLANAAFIPWKFYPRNSDFEPKYDDSANQITQIIINQNSSTEDESSEIRSFLDQDESYDVEITEDGQVTLSSNSTLGTVRALETLHQLFYTHSSAGSLYTNLAPVRISDKPTFRHRGLNLDISRNSFSPRDVMRSLDAMATVKLNRLHIHATDAQSWPIEVPALPDLAAKGAYQPYLAWTPSDLQEVQLYGLYRGISVFIEIDMPGHTASIHHAYPDLITGFNNPDWSTYAAEPPSGELKLNSTAVYDFLSTLFADLLPRMNPFTSYFHTGGDEVNVNDYLLDETVKSNSSSVLQPLLQTFINRVHASVRENDLVPIVWEEMLLDWNLTFPSPTNSTSEKSDVIVQTWRSAEALSSVLKKGYRALFGAYDYWYLDCGQGGFINPIPGDPQSLIHDPFLDYCNPVKNWRHIYSYNPYTNITADLFHLMEGGEVHMWTEQTDPVTMDRMIWPRAAAAAEVLWSGPKNGTNLTEVSRRLGMWRERVVLEGGVQAGMVQMTWCLMGEGSCEL